MRKPQDRKTELGVNVPTTSWRGLRGRDFPEQDFFWLGGGAGRTTIRYFGSASTTASVTFPSVGRGKNWFGDTLLPYPRRKPSSFTFGFGRRNFKRMESLVVLMCTFRLGLLPLGNFCAFPRARAILPQRSRHPRLESMLHLPAHTGSDAAGCLATLELHLSGRPPLTEAGGCTEHCCGLTHRRWRQDDITPFPTHSEKKK